MRNKIKRNYTIVSCMEKPSINPELSSKITSTEEIRDVNEHEEQSELIWKSLTSSRMMDHDLMAMTGETSLANPITTLGSFADSPITGPSSIIVAGNTDIDNMVPDATALISEVSGNEAEHLIHDGTSTVMMIDGSVSSALMTDTHNLDAASMISVCGTSLPLYTESIPSSSLMADGSQGTSLMTESRDQPSLVPDGSGLVLLEMPKGSNMLLSVSGDIGGVNYGIPVSSTDLQGRHLLSTTIPASLLSSVQQDGIVDQHGVSVLLGVGGEGEEGLDGSDIGQPVESLLDVSPDTTTSREPEPKKRGGWPKGKRRKALPDITAPKAPLTGYVIFAKVRRQEIKASNPDLLFTEITKILGQEWSSMDMEKKQKYLEEADKDKQRYVDELKVFQQSEAYNNLVKKKKSMSNYQGSDCYGPESSHLDEDDEDNELHCKVCDQYFSSLHNKKEHMFGRQHLQNVTDELNKEIKLQSAQQSQDLLTTSLGNGHFTPDREQLEADQGGGLQEDAPVDIQGFINSFIQDNYERELEIRQLKAYHKMLQSDNANFYEQINELKNYQNKLVEDIANEKTITSSLNNQIDALKMVSTLFGVINFHDM